MGPRARCQWSVALGGGGGQAASAGGYSSEAGAQARQQRRQQGQARQQGGEGHLQAGRSPYHHCQVRSHRARAHVLHYGRRTATSLLSQQDSGLEAHAGQRMLPA